MCSWDLQLGASCATAKGQQGGVDHTMKFRAINKKENQQYRVGSRAGIASF